jgi:vacuolar-type H+-ATPase subunit H
MAKAVWEELQTTEARAEQMIAEAKSASAAALREARQTATNLIHQAEEEARLEGEQLVKKATASAETAKEAHLKAVAEKVQKINAVGAGRLPDAVKMIVEKVVS